MQIFHVHAVPTLSELGQELPGTVTGTKCQSNDSLLSFLTVKRSSFLTVKTIHVQCCKGRKYRYATKTKLAVVTSKHRQQDVNSIFIPVPISISSLMPVLDSISIPKSISTFKLI